MSSLPRRVAVVCIVATLLPHVAAASVAVHVLLEHGDEHGGAVPQHAMTPSLHGHAHAAGTPEHDHALTAPAPGGEASRVRGALQLAALSAGCAAAWAAGTPAHALAAGDRPQRERPAQASPTVLRI